MAFNLSARVVRIQGDSAISEEESEELFEWSEAFLDDLEMVLTQHVQNKDPRLSVTVKDG